jgi:hypothetical protein
MTTEIETYLNSLSYDTLIIDISGGDINSLPDLTRFKNLEILRCSYNKLTSLPTLPQNLKILHCSNNQLIICYCVNKCLICICYDIFYHFFIERCNTMFI